MGIFEYDEEKCLEMERKEAEARGEARGEARLSQLLSKLLSVGKLEDIQRVAEDEKFREQLYKEYRI